MPYIYQLSSSRAVWRRSNSSSDVLVSAWLADPLTLLASVSYHLQCAVRAPITSVLLDDQLHCFPVSSAILSLHFVLCPSEIFPVVFVGIYGEQLQTDVFVLPNIFQPDEYAFRLGDGQVLLLRTVQQC